MPLLDMKLEVERKIGAKKKHLLTDTKGNRSRQKEIGRVIDPNKMMGQTDRQRQVYSE